MEQKMSNLVCNRESLTIWMMKRVYADNPSITRIVEKS